MNAYKTWSTATTPLNEELSKEIEKLKNDYKQLYEANLKLTQQNNTLTTRLAKLTDTSTQLRLDPDDLDLPSFVIGIARLIDEEDTALDLPGIAIQMQKLIDEKYPYRPDVDSYDPAETSDEQLLWLVIAFLSGIEAPDDWVGDDDQFHIGFHLSNALKALNFYLERHGRRY